MKRSAGNNVPSSSSTAQTDARVRNDFVPASQRAVFEKIRDLVSPTVPLANLPDTHKSRWGDELTAEKMKEWIWLRPEAVAQIEFSKEIWESIRAVSVRGGRSGGGDRRGVDLGDSEELLTALSRAAS